MAVTDLSFWSDAALRADVAAYGGTRYYSNLPKATQFIHAVARILARRTARAKNSLCSAPSIFVLAPRPEVADVTWQQEPSFDMGGVEVAGRIWFGAEGMIVANGTSPPAIAGMGNLFDYVSKTLASGTFPTVLFDGAVNHQILRFYPNGVDNPMDCTDILVSGANVSKAALKVILDRIHKESLMTPTSTLASGGLWKNSRKCHPVKEIEKQIQTHVQTGLIYSLAGVRVEHEGTGQYGRFDLALKEQDPLDPSKLTHLAILELKVVKGFTSSGKRHGDAANQVGVLKGLKQAYSYREEHGARITAVCCFDMRPTPTLHNFSGSACRLATDLDVEFWAWPLFHTAEKARNALVSKHRATGKFKRRKK